MILALLVAVLSVLLGAAVSFLPTTSRAVLGYLRTFATLAAVAVVFTHLLPEALRAFGPPSILLFLAGWFAPTVAHYIGQRGTSGRAAPAVLEAGYWGLLVHHVADGIGLGTYARLPADHGSHLDVVVALAAHTVPLIAVVSLAYRTTFGARAALLRSLGLALASVLGIALSSLVAARTIEAFAPVIAAVAAGLLLHVVTHDLTEDSARAPLARLLDLAVAALGVGVGLLGVWHGAEPATRAFAERLQDFTERSSVVILVALAASAFSLRLPERQLHERRSKFARALLPAGALGAESALLSMALFGFVAAGLRLLVTGAAVALLSGARVEHSRVEHARAEPDAAPHWRARASETLEESGPWLVLGLLLGALLLAVPAAALSHRPTPWITLLLATGIANLTPVAAPAAVLIAIGLSALGFSSGAVLVFATLAPIAAFLGSAVKPRVLVSFACLVLGAASDAASLPVASLDGALSHGELGVRAALGLGALLLFGVWQRGARVWLSTIVPPAPHEHEHAHDVHGPHAHSD